MSCAAGSQRFRNASSFSRAGIPHAGKLRAEIWHANVSENPFAHAADRTEYHSYFTLPSRFAATLLASAMPAPATARLGRLQLQGGGEATEGPNAMGSNVPTIEELGDDSGRSRWGPAVDPSMRFRDSPSTLVGSTLAADDHEERLTWGIISTNLECPPAVAGWNAILPYGPGGGVDGAAAAAWQSPPRDITGLRC